MRSTIRAGAFCLCAGLAANAAATVLNFDSEASGTIADSFYPGLTFSSEAGLNTAVLAYAGPSPHSPGNVLVPWNAQFSVPSAVSDLYVDFNPPVNGLSFLAVAADEFGVVARVNVYTTGNVLLGTDDIIGTAAAPATFGLGSTLVNLGAYSNVTRIEIVPPIGDTLVDYAYGGGGLAYDDFTFEAVPEPGAAVLLGAAALLLRRR